MANKKYVYTLATFGGNVEVGNSMVYDNIGKYTKVNRNELEKNGFKFVKHVNWVDGDKKFSCTTTSGDDIIKFKSISTMFDTLLLDDKLDRELCDSVMVHMKALVIAVPLNGDALWDTVDSTTETMMKAFEKFVHKCINRFDCMEETLFVIRQDKKTGLYSVVNLDELNNADDIWFEDSKSCSDVYIFIILIAILVATSFWKICSYLLWFYLIR